MIITSPVGQTHIEPLAASELQKYIHLSGVCRQLDTSDEMEAVDGQLHNQWQTAEIILNVREKSSVGHENDEGFIWSIESKSCEEEPGNKTEIVITGNSPKGLLNGVYTFIEHYLGFKFTMTGEQKSTPLMLPDKEEFMGQPLFPLRGTIPWHNFLGGPSGWNRKDYFTYVDRLSKMRCNLVAFHVYTGGLERYWTYVEPFIKVHWQGIEPEAQLDTTRTARWGYIPRKTSHFLAGTHSYFDKDDFGSDLALECSHPSSHYDRAKDLLRELIDFAHERGIRVAIGFEPGIVPPEIHSLIQGNARLENMVLDPFHPESQEILANTIRYIAEAYPDIDYVMLWQHEHSLFMHHLPRKGTEFEQYCNGHHHLFSELEPGRQMDGCWALAMFHMSYHLCKKWLPNAQVVVSGWGGADQLPKLLNGLHKKLPEEIIFSCLAPSLGEKEGPQELLDIQDRDVWLIPWFEGDHQFWHPQPRIFNLEKQIQSGNRHNVKGFMGIHWRIREIEDQFVYFSERLWDRTITPAGFYQRRWQNRYPEWIDNSLLEDIVTMDRDYWYRGVQSPEFYGFTSRWGRIPEGVYEKFKDLHEKLEAMRMEKNDSPVYQLLCMLELTLLLHDISTGLEKVEKIKYEILRNQCDGMENISGSYEALRILTALPVEKAIAAYAKKLDIHNEGPSYRGELGVLCSLNQRLGTYYQEMIKFFNGKEKSRH